MFADHDLVLELWNLSLHGENFQVQFVDLVIFFIDDVDQSLQIVLFAFNRNLICWINIISCNTTLFRLLLIFLILIVSTTTLIFCASAIEIFIFILWFYRKWRGIVDVNVRLRARFTYFTMRTLFIDLVGLWLVSILWGNFHIVLDHIVQIHVTYYLWLRVLLVMMIKLKTLIFLTGSCPWC